MFGVKIRPHRSLFIFGIIACFLIILLLKSYGKKPVIEKVDLENEEDINLIDLFNNAYKLTYQAGEAIKLFKNSKTKFEKISKKKSFKNLPSEPVTIADLISHSILANGLKKNFPNLKVFSSF